MRIFNFRRWLQTIFHSGSNSLYSQEQEARALTLSEVGAYGP